MKRRRDYETADTHSRPYQQVVQEAARLLAQGEASGFDDARHKALARAGVTLRRLPDNAAIEQAMMEYRRLFHAATHNDAVRELRLAAINAMRLLARFQPCLVGPVLSGNAPPHSPIHLHLFADSPESVPLFLLEHNIPCSHDERRVRFSIEQWEAAPLYRFVAGNITLELTVFPAHGLRRRPLSPVDNRPMARADLAALEQLVEEDGRTS